MKEKKLATSATKEDLEKLINEFYFSKNYKITEDNLLSNDLLSEEKLQRINSQVGIKKVKNRWVFYIK